MIPRRKVPQQTETPRAACSAESPPEEQKRIGYAANKETQFGFCCFFLIMISFFLNLFCKVLCSPETNSWRTTTTVWHTSFGTVCLPKERKNWRFIKSPSCISPTLSPFVRKRSFDELAPNLRFLTNCLSHRIVPIPFWPEQLSSCSGSISRGASTSTLTKYVVRDFAWMDCLLQNIALSCYSLCLKLQDEYKFYDFSYSVMCDSYCNLLNSINPAHHHEVVFTFAGMHGFDLLCL